MGGAEPAHHPAARPARGRLHQSPHHPPGRAQRRRGPRTPAGRPLRGLRGHRQPAFANALRMVLTEPGFRAQFNGGQMGPCRRRSSSPVGRAAVQHRLRLLRQAGHRAGRPVDPQGGRAAASRPRRQRRPAGAGPTCPRACRGNWRTRLRRRSARVPRPGHRPRHRGRRRRRVADPAARHPSWTARGGPALAVVHRLAAPGGSCRCAVEPKPQQDVDRRRRPCPSRSSASHWQVGTLSTDPTPAAEPQLAAARPAATPRPRPRLRAPASPAAPARSRGLWGRLLVWWRGE